MPKRTKSSGNRAVLALMLIAALGVGGFAAYVKLDPAARRVPEDLRKPPVETPHDDEADHVIPRPAPKGPDVSVTRSDADTLRIPSVDDANNVKLGDPAPAVPDGVDPKVFIATSTLGALKIDKARAIGVTIKERNALVDFSPRTSARVREQ